MLIAIIALVAFVSLASVPAAIAYRKNRSVVAFFLFGLVLFLPALVVAVLMSPLDAPADDATASHAPPAGAATKDRISVGAVADVPEVPRCPNGHDVEAGSPSCPACGVVLWDYAVPRV